MREVRRGELESVRQVMERHRERLLAMAGVHHVDIGFKYVGGQATDEMAIRLHVAQKMPAQRLAAADLPPEEIETIPVDVMVSEPGAHPETVGKSNGLTPID